MIKRGSLSCNSLVFTSPAHKSSPHQSAHFDLEALVLDLTLVAASYPQCSNFLNGHLLFYCTKQDCFLDFRILILNYGGDLPPVHNRSRIGLLLKAELSASLAIFSCCI